MVDIQYIKTHVEEMKQNLKDRQISDEIIDELLALDGKRFALQYELEEKNRERNENAKKLQDMPDKQSPEAKELIAKGKQIKEEAQGIEESLAPIETAYMNLALRIPNIISPQMPIGASDKDNVEIKVHGEKPTFTFTPKDHVELGKALDIIDVERSAKVSGSRFYYLKNEAVLMQFAIMMHLTQLLMKKGFIPMIPPILVKEQAMIGTGYFPMEESQVYTIKGENIEEGNTLFLAGTAEVPTVSYHSGEIFAASELPIKYIAFSPAFRSEVGSWGKDVRGIKRVHQFDKLEMVVFAHPDQSEKIHEELLAINEEFLSSLGLPYHVLNMCSGDVGYPTYKKYDVEVYIPSQGAYCETMSTSNIHEYQARRLNIKYKDSEGKLHYIHTLNATAAAIPRILLSILENNQQEDRSVKIPDVLLPYIAASVSSDGFIHPKQKVI